MTGPRPAGRRWTLTDDDMLRKLLASGVKPRLIAQKLKRSIGAIQSRVQRRLALRSSALDMVRNVGRNVFRARASTASEFSIIPMQERRRKLPDEPISRTTNLTYGLETRFQLNNFNRLSCLCCK
jgi:hypothetical protein